MSLEARKVSGPGWLQPAVVVLMLLAAMPLRADTQVFDFRVLLEDREIGTHQFEVSRTDGQQEIVSQADFDVRLLFVPVYAYAHRNREVWQDGCLQRMESRTDDNGRDYRVSARREADGLRVATDAGEAQLQGCVHTFAYWDAELLNADALLNVQNGRHVAVTTRDEGLRQLLIDDRQVPARQWRITSDDGLDILVWYAQGSGRWLGLQTRRDGRLLRYVPAEAERFTLDAAA